MAKKKQADIDIPDFLLEYKKLVEYMNLPEEERCGTSVPDIDWKKLVRHSDDILLLMKDPAKMYPEVDSFEEVGDMDAQRLLYALEKKAAHCGDQPLYIQVRSICNFIGFLIYAGREMSGEPERFSGVDRALTTHELAFMARGIYKTLFDADVSESIPAIVESQAQESLPDILSIIRQVAETGYLVAQVGTPEQVEQKPKVRRRRTQNKKNLDC
jgi:hypothetical protein